MLWGSQGYYGGPGVAIPTQPRGAPQTLHPSTHVPVHLCTPAPMHSGTRASVHPCTHAAVHPCTPAPAQPVDHAGRNQRPEQGQTQTGGSTVSLMSPPVPPAPLPLGSSQLQSRESIPVAAGLASRIQTRTTLHPTGFCAESPKFLEFPWGGSGGGAGEGSPLSSQCVGGCQRVLGCDAKGVGHQHGVGDLC